MAFNANLFSNTSDFGGQTFSVTGNSSLYTGYSNGQTSLNSVLAAYNSRDCSNAGATDTSCNTIKTDMGNIYNSIKTSIEPGLSSASNKQTELKNKLPSMHSETGILATQHSDYMSTVLSTVLWTTLAGSVVALLILKNSTK